MSCITLLSDFGLQDASVAAAKGVLMQHVPGLPVVDISHLVEPFHLQQAAYLLLAAYKNFPAGTCHVLLFDIFSEKSPKLILAEQDGHYFLAPDNGLMSLVLTRPGGNTWLVAELSYSGVFRDWLDKIGATLKALQSMTAKEMNLPAYELKQAPQYCQPKVGPNSLECHVIHIDRYENVVLNITKQQFEETGKGRNFRISFMRDEEITEISTHYYNVRPGEKLCRFNQNGYLEIAINRSKAASLFGLTLYREQHLFYNTIKIFFE